MFSITPVTLDPAVLGKPLVYGAQMLVMWSPPRSTISTISNCSTPSSFIGFLLNTPAISATPPRIAEKEKDSQQEGEARAWLMSN